jgi:hypothetical protein
MKQDSRWAATMVVLTMALAIYAAGPAAGLLVGSAVAGLAVAVIWIRRSRG